MGEYAAEKHVDLMIFVGKLAKQMAAGAGSAARHFETQEALLEELPNLVFPEDTVLVKASRGMRLERTVEALTKEK